LVEQLRRGQSERGTGRTDAEAHAAAALAGRRGREVRPGGRPGDHELAARPDDVDARVGQHPYGAPVADPHARDLLLKPRRRCQLAVRHACSVVARGRLAGLGGWLPDQLGDVDHEIRAVAVWSGPHVAARSSWGRACTGAGRPVWLRHGQRPLRRAPAWRRGVHAAPAPAGDRGVRRDGAEVSLPAGGCLAVRSGAARSATATEDGTSLLIVGSPRGQAYRADGWELGYDAFEIYKTGDYEAARAAYRNALDQAP